MTFSFGSRTERNIHGLNPKLVEVIRQALTITPVDFGVLDLGGIRNAAQQHSLYVQGRFGNPGKTVTDKSGAPGDESVHQSGNAVDLVPFMNGAPTWNWEFIFPVIQSVALAARAEGVSLRWGGVWDRKLEDLNAEDLHGEVAAYCQRHPGPDHIDGPHIEYLGEIE